MYARVGVPGGALVDIDAFSSGGVQLESRLTQTRESSVGVDASSGRRRRRTNVQRDVVVTLVNVDAECPVARPAETLFALAMETGVCVCVCLGVCEMGVCAVYVSV